MYHRTTFQCLTLFDAVVESITVARPSLIFVLWVPSYSQQDATFLDLLIFTDALHVSGGSSAHHQEHITVHTASGIVNQYCC